jgi:hypothetical protein
MKCFIHAALAAGLVLGSGQLAPAEVEPDAKPVLDKAIQALGGAARLGAIKAIVWKSKGKIRLNDNDSDFTTKTTAQGIDHFRVEIEGGLGGNPIKVVTVLDGNKAWRRIGDDTSKLENGDLANEKRNTYLQIVPEMPTLLRGKGFKVEAGKDEKIGDKPVAVLKITGPDGKDFQLAFDKESGLPVRMTATVADYQGDEYKQESTFSNYKDFGGVKRATKVETKRNGNKFVDAEITEVRILDKVDPKTFAEPKAD